MGLASIPTYATGDTIEASWANTLRDNGLVLDARTGGDPGATGKILVSNGVLGAVWTALIALVNNIATTGTFGAASAIITGAFSAASAVISGNFTAGTYNGGTTGGGGIAAATVSAGTGGVGTTGDVSGRDVSASRDLTVLRNFNGGSTSGGAIAVAGYQAGTSGFTGTGPVSGTTATFSDALAALSAAITNAITAATLTLTGLCKARTFESTVATGTPPMVVASTDLVSNLHAAVADSASAIADGAVSTTAKLASLVVTAAKIANKTITAAQIADTTITDLQVAAANKNGAASTQSMRTLGTGATEAAAGNHGHTGMALIASGSFVGTGSAGRQITPGFLCKSVELVTTSTTTPSNGQVIFEVKSATANRNVRISGSAGAAIIQPCSVARLDASDGFFVGLGDGSDDSNFTYFWTALG